MCTHKHNSTTIDCMYICNMKPFTQPLLPHNVKTYGQSQCVNIYGVLFVDIGMRRADRERESLWN